MKEYDKKEYLLSWIDAVESPITYLYQQFSRMEKSKRKVAELELEDAKKEIFKELLKMYVEGDVIQLNEKDFDDFINFCNVDIGFIKNCTRYEFIMFIKKKYTDFMDLPVNFNR